MRQHLRHTTSVPVPLAPAATDPAELEREAGVARLFEQHYASMLRLAVLLGADDPENVVAEAYYQIYRKWRRLRDTEAAEAYLRSTVCNLTRMRIRHLQVARRHVENPLPRWTNSSPPPRAPHSSTTTSASSSTPSSNCRPGSARRWCCDTGSV